MPGFFSDALRIRKLQAAYMGIGAGAGALAGYTMDRQHRIKGALKGMVVGAGLGYGANLMQASWARGAASSQRISAGLARHGVMLDDVGIKRLHALRAARFAKGYVAKDIVSPIANTTLGMNAQVAYGSLAASRFGKFASRAGDYASVGWDAIGPWGRRSAMAAAGYGAYRSLRS